MPRQDHPDLHNVRCAVQRIATGPDVQVDIILGSKTGVELADEGFKCEVVAPRAGAGSA